MKEPENTINRAPFDRSQLNYARKTIRDKLGSQIIKELHKKNSLLDTVVFFGSITSTILVSYLLAQLTLGPVWLLLFCIQGVLAQLMMLISHDLFVHRKFGGEFWSWVGSMLITIPRFSLPSGYEQAHLAHHRYIGSERDTEIYKQDINTRFKRLLFSTVIGVKLAQFNCFSHENRKSYHSVEDLHPTIQKKATIEKRIMRLWLLALFPLGYFFPEYIIEGYILPVLIVLPILNTLRIIIEHSDVRPENPFNQSTFYETGILTRLVFFWDSGDCHIIHHIFPRMPWYRVGKAVDLIKPVLLEQGAIKRSSFWWLVKGWYINNYEHRTTWPLHNTSPQDSADR